MNVMRPFLFFILLSGFSVLISSIPVHSHPRDPFNSVLGMLFRNDFFFFFTHCSLKHTESAFCVPFFLG